MNSYRKNAVIVGVLFIACSAATLLSYPFSGPILDDQDYLAKLAGNETLVIIGAFIEFIWAATCTGIVIWAYPILKKYNGALALWSVGFRIVEGVFVIIGTLSLLSLLSLSQEFVKAGVPDASSFQTSGTLLLAVRDWAHNFVLMIPFALGALLFYFILYRSKLIPRWLSGWGFIGAALSIVATLYYSFTHDLGLIHTLMSAPIGLNELVLAVWLIVKGFNSSAIASLSAETDTK